MPQLGETVTEGTIIRWLKQVGDTIAQDEPLFEVSTDKVDSEVPSPAAGGLTEILVPEGETVDVGAPLPVVGDAAPSPAPAPAPVGDSDGTRGALLSPVVRKLISENGLDPALIPGTGMGGRITRDDVQQVLEARSSAPAPAAAPVVAAPVPAPAPAPAAAAPQ